MTVRGDGTRGAGGDAVNIAGLVGYDLPAAINGNNTQGDPTSRRSYTRPAAAGLQLPAPTIVKTPPSQTINIGGTVNFTITITVPAGTALYDASIGDTLPAGLEFAPAGITPGPAPEAGCPAPANTGGGTAPLGLGDLQNTTNHVCTYTATVAAESGGTVPPPGSESATVINTGTLTYSTTNGGASTTLPVTAAVTIQAPVLRFNKAVNPTGPVANGQTLNYALSYANTGLAPATGVVITDRCDPKTVITNPGGGTVNPDGDPNTCDISFDIGTVAAGAGGTVTFSVQVVVVVPPIVGIVVNGAILSSNELPDLRDSVVNGAVNVAIDKTVSAAVAEPGDTLTYTITLTNASPATAAATNVIVTDEIPLHTTYVNNSAAVSGVPGTAAFSGGANALTFTIPSLAVNATATLTFDVVIDAPLTNNTVLVNTAVYTSDQEPDGGNSPHVPTIVVSAPILALTKTNNPTGPIGVDGEILYTLTITNTGNENAENVLVTDQVPAGTTFVEASNGGTHVTASGTVAWYIGVLPVGGSASATFRVRATADPATGQLPPGATISNQASYAYRNAAGGNQGTGQSNTVTNATLSHTLDKSNLPTDRVPAGGVIRYTLVYRNTGSGDFASVTLNDRIPANTTFVSADNGGTEAGGIVTWNLGAVPAGQERTVTLVVRVNAPLPSGTALFNVARAQATGAASGTIPNVFDFVRNTVVSTPIFTITKQNNPTTVVRSGWVIIYTLQVTNIGNENATNVTVTDTIPDGTTYVPGSATGGSSITGSGRTITWTIASLPVRTVETLRFAVTVNDTLPTDTNGIPIDIVNTAHVTASTETGTLDPPVDSNEVRNPTMGEQIVKSSEPASGSETFYGAIVTYTIAYKNTGSIPLTGVHVVDFVPAQTAFVDAANGGVFTAGGLTERGLVTWAIGTLAPGQSGTVSYRVRVDNPTDPAGVAIVNTSTLISNERLRPLISNQVVNPTSPPPIHSLAGRVYVDTNDNGQVEAGEAGIGGATITLTGTDTSGTPASRTASAAAMAPVNRTVTTAADGTYIFTDLFPGTYTITETQPTSYLDGRDTPGSLGGTVTANDVIGNIVLPNGGAGTEYNFGERPPPSPSPSPSPRPPAPDPEPPAPPPSPAPGCVCPPIAPIPDTAEQRYFPQTQHSVRGRFLDYYDRNGGLFFIGLPLCEEEWETLEDGRAYRVQYFERARLEYHPEHAGTPYEILLGRLTVELTGGRPFPPGSASGTPFGHDVAPEFQAFYTGNGGLARFGWPLSAGFREVNEADGKEYFVQYYERQRFELHPELAGTPYEVLLGQLGREVYLRRPCPTDLAVALTGPPSYTPGQSASYTVTVTNKGPGAVTGAHVRATPPPGVTDLAWACGATTGGGVCGGAGSGILSPPLDLPVGASVTLTLTFTVPPGATGPLTLAAVAEPPQLVLDLVPGNNTATATTPAP